MSFSKKELLQRVKSGTVPISVTRIPAPRPVPKSVKRYVKRAIDRKRETLEKISFGSAVDLSYDAPTIVDLTAISQDVTEDGRTGEYVDVKSIKFKGYVVRGTADSYARVLIVQWRPDTAADSLALSDLFNQGASVLNAYWQAARSDSKADGEWKVLYDQRIPLISAAGNKTYQLISKNIYKGFTSKVSFQDNNTTGMNHIFLLAFSNVTDASGSEPDLFYDITVSYKD